MSTAGRGCRARRSSARRVGVLTKRGRMTVVEPLFERGRRMAVDLRRRKDLRIGDLVLVRPVGARERRGRGARLEVERSLGRPDVARDVVEALLYERGHHRASASAVEGEARERRRCARRARTARPDRAADVHDRSAQREGLRRRAVGRARRGRHAAARPHRGRGGVRAAGPPRWTRRRAARQQRLRAGCRRADAAPRVVLGGVQPGPGRAPQRGDGRGRRRRRRAPSERLLLPQPDPLRRPPRVRAGRPDLRRAKSALRTRSRSRWHWRARSRGSSARPGSRAGRSRVESSEPDFEFDEDGNVVAARDEIQTEAHWVIEHLMILANEQVAQRAGVGGRTCPVPRARAARSRRDRASRRAAREPRRADTAGAEGDVARRCRAAGRRDQRPRAGVPARHRARWQGV